MKCGAEACTTPALLIWGSNEGLAIYIDIVHSPEVLTRPRFLEVWCLKRVMFDKSVSVQGLRVQEFSWTLPKTMQEITASRWPFQVRQVRHFSRDYLAL